MCYEARRGRAGLAVGHCSLVKLQIQKVHEGGWWPIGSWTDKLQNGIPKADYSQMGSTEKRAE